MRLCYHCMTQIQEEKINICPGCGRSLMLTEVENRYLKPGTELQNKFIVGYPIGAGGFGNTYIGWNKLLLRRVAIKEFYPEQYITRAEGSVTVSVASASLQPRFHKGLQQFLEEARSVASLQDIEGVVEISNFFEQNGTGYIIMEYLEGMDVKTILKKSEDRKDYEWCRRVILTLLNTLQQIHKRGVLHRDIAPDNIFVTSEGVIKLIDFGAARHSSVLANMKSDVVLKVGYAPIEQYSREAPQGPYTDLYAVAALFYRMLTGQKPIPANERVENDTLIPPSQMGVELPEQAEFAIMTCLSIQPKYRLQSAAEFMDALDGKNFIPVYEPEWILPAVEEKKTFSSMSLGARIGIVFAVICLVMGAAFGGTTLLHNSENKESLSNSNEILPDLSGKTIRDAENELKRAGVENYVIAYEFSSKPEDTVIRQYPEAGMLSDQEVAATLYVSGGDSQYTLEDFTGKNIDEIRSYFSRYEFDIYESAYPGAESTVDGEKTSGESAGRKGTVTLKREYSDDYADGVCCSQSLSPGELCDGSEDLTFVISCGKPSDYEIEIPDFTGQGKKSVEKALKKIGLSDYLKLQFEDGSYSDDIEKGDVAKQNILPGTVYNRLEGKLYRYADGARIDEQSDGLLTLWLSAGKEPVRTTTESAGASGKSTEGSSKKSGNGSSDGYKLEIEDDGDAYLDF